MTGRAALVAVGSACVGIPRARAGGGPADSISAEPGSDLRCCHPVVTAQAVV
jgi:hypothetical protein